MSDLVSMGINIIVISTGNPTVNNVQSGVVKTDFYSMIHTGLFHGTIDGNNSMEFTLYPTFVPLKGTTS